MPQKTESFSSAHLDVTQLETINIISSRLRETSTIATTICLLSNVDSILLSDSSLTGTIPSCLGMLSQLTRLEMNDNLLSGTLPSSLGYLKKLRILNLFNNQLIGNIPESILQIPQLEVLDMHNCLFNGTLPPITNDNSSIIYLDFGLNSLSGSIPSAYLLLTNCHTINLNRNQLSGTIPTVDKVLSKLQYFDLSSNKLYGIVPGELYQHPLLEILLLSSNSFIGNLPVIFTHSLKYIFLDNNKLSGTISDGLLKLSNTVALYLNNNQLTGTLKSFQSMSSIRFLNLNKNQLGGPLSSLDLNVTNLEFIDVSNNRITGSIPSALFGPRLQEFAAASNCLEIVIPEEICNARELRVIVLDGMHSGQSCRTLYFTGTFSKSYGLTIGKHRGIPPCLYSMPNLNVLHLSGNVLTGTIPSDIDLSQSIQDLTLSHNALHGSIPVQIQSRFWRNLDLSYNKFSGILTSNMKSNSTIALKVNRLSGPPPASLHDAQHINVLQGNLFLCDFNQHKLPSHDPYRSSYNCGSDSLEISFYVYLSIIFIGILCLMVLHLNKNKFVLSLWDYVLSHTRRLQDASAFDSAMGKFRALVTVQALVTLIFLLPTYGALGLYYGTHQYRYAWSVSVAYLSGVTPAIVLAVLWSFFLFTYYVIMLRNPMGVQRTNYHLQIRSRSFYFWVIYALLILFNFIVTLVINGVYVNSAIYLGTTLSVFAQSGLGCVKALWNILFVENVSKIQRYCVSTSEEDELHDTLSVAMIVILNNIAIPCLAEALVDSNCFYNMIYASKSISVTYNTGNICLSPNMSMSTSCFTNIVEGSTEYDPPFIYNYQCSSVLVTNYTSVFVYSYLVISVWAIITPRWQKLKSIIKNEAYQIPVLKISNYCARLLSALMIMMTFGVMFPPLSIVIAIAICIDTYCTQYMVANQWMGLDGDVPNLHGTSVHFLGILVALFYAFLIYDIAGDVQGAVQAIWAPAAVLVIPMCYIFRTNGIRIRSGPRIATT